MKYYEDGQWKEIQVKVANAIQNEYGESNNDGYSQNYLNDKVVNVSNEVDEDYRVNLLHSKNLTDGIWENGGWSSTGEKADSPSFTRTANPIYVKPNTTYTLKISKSNNQIVIYYYSASGYMDLAFVQNTDTYTFTTPANCVKINFRLSGQGISYTNTMLNEGSTALPYEPYVVPSIYVDNEEIYNQNIMNYSTTEQRIGTWIDGKPLYRKVIQTKMPTVTGSSRVYKYIDCDSLNIEQITNISGVVNQDKYAIWPIPYGNPTTSPALAAFLYYKCNVQEEGKNSITISSNVNWLNNCDAFITIEYTKTTD